MLRRARLSPPARQVSGRPGHGGSGYRLVYGPSDHKHFGREPQAPEIADSALLMQGSDRYAVGLADEVLSEARLGDLYGLPIQAATVYLDGRRGTTMIPVLSGKRTDIEGARP